jgi:hypothetical protein
MFVEEELAARSDEFDAEVNEFAERNVNDTKRPTRFHVTLPLSHQFPPGLPFLNHQTRQTRFKIPRQLNPLDWRNSQDWTYQLNRLSKWIVYWKLW